jgi:hypothetical protein
MDKPKCRLCGYKHSLSEPHVIPDTVLGVKPKTNRVTETPKLDTKPVTKEPEVTKPVTDKQTKHCPTCRCIRVYKSNAERQRAYRARRAQ